jgi:histidinol dehydrogenase
VTTSATAPWARHVWRELAAEDRDRILRRSTSAIFDPSLLADVRALIEDVRARGDAAVSDALARFDGCEVPPDRLVVDAAEIDEAVARIPPRLADAIRFAHERMRRYNEAQLDGATWEREIAPGVVVGERHAPMQRVALFVPSGKASYPSVVLHLGVPATVARVPEVVIVVPPRPGAGGAVDDAVLFAARELGITEVYRANGPAGIAAAALGTERLPRAEFVVGPGSPAVAAAQVLVQLEGVATNLLLGPSESIVIADDGAAPDVIAADLLNEAEHGADSASILLTPSRPFANAVETALARRLAELPEPRREYAASALSRFGGLVLVDDLAEAAEVANAYAPEHLVIDVRNPDRLLDRLRYAGEILVGPYLPPSAANFAVGVPASLPTGGYARRASGVTARTFLTSTSVARVSREALATMRDCVLALAEHEGFPAHANAYLARFPEPRA